MLTQLALFLIALSFLPLSNCATCSEGVERFYFSKWSYGGYVYGSDPLVTSLNCCNNNICNYTIDLGINVRLSGIKPLPDDPSDYSDKYGIANISLSFPAYPDKNPGGIQNVLSNEMANCLVPLSIKHEENPTPIFCSAFKSKFQPSGMYVYDVVYDGCKNLNITADIRIWNKIAPSSAPTSYCFDNALYVPKQVFRLSRSSASCDFGRCTNQYPFSTASTTASTAASASASSSISSTLASSTTTISATPSTTTASSATTSSVASSTTVSSTTSSAASSTTTGSKASSTTVSSTASSTTTSSVASSTTTKSTSTSTTGVSCPDPPKPGSARNCAYFGDPHLIAFDSTFHTCATTGTTVLYDNDYISVVSTDVRVSDTGVTIDGPNATLSSKVVITYKQCNQQTITINATHFPEPQNPNPSSKHKITKTKDGQYFMPGIHTVVGVKALLKIFLSIFIRTQQPGTGVCQSLCPAGTEVLYRHKRDFEPSGDAQTACQGLDEPFFTACTFDVTVTNNTEFVAAANASSVQFEESKNLDVAPPASTSSSSSAVDATSSTASGSSTSSQSSSSAVDATSSTTSGLSTSTSSTPASPEDSFGQVCSPFIPLIVLLLGFIL